ncbi:tRNA-uridine aminocarboxypropyltransferase [Polaromonas sp.]|uniref:tRNA-uridine aminocarboxypropyltransferase n=1 Tax=Polaromonas sp. TaxID=1869339 RepID=UPI003BB546EF
MTQPFPARRPACATCLRPQSACICQWITPVAHEVEVLILQHPLEVSNAKGSARLLHLSLPRSRLVTGEVFDLPALLGAPPGSGPTRQSILLYPDTPQDQAPDLSPPPRLAPALLREPSQLRLIVLDGTWRKSRKMLYRNPLLQQLPRLSLHDMPASHYLIRKAHRPDQLSTLEASCAALAQLEGGAERFEPLLAAFDGFVAQQLGYRASSGAAGLQPVNS